MRIVMPTAPATSKSNGSFALQSVSAQSANGTSWNSTINPTVGSDINCFAVFVGGGELGANSCSISNGTTISFGPHVGFLKAGEEIFVDTPAGDRTIYVIGLKSATAAACSNFTNSEPDGANLSEPFLIAAQRSNIPSGQSTLTINAALDTGKKVQDCNFISPTGGGQQNPFGDKRDGIITTAITTAYMDGNSDNLGVSGVSHSSSAGQVPSTKIFNASRRITSVVNTGTDAGKLITLGSNFISSEFEPGDEIIWYVAGGASSAGPPDHDTLGACGGGLYTGRYGTSRVASTPTSNQLLLESAISSTPLGIKNTNLAAPSNTTNYCTVVISRISSFEQINVPAGDTLQLSPPLFDYTNGLGGVMAVRADTITVDGTLLLYGSASGYSGGSASGIQGDGINAIGISSYSPNYNGGGGGNPSSIAGGSGSNAGVGGDGASNTGSGSSNVSHCNGLCTPFVDKKAFFGGGGGGAYGAGGRGGGLVLLFAKSISGTGNVYLKADGASGAGGSAAGGSGAGGTVGLFAKLVSVGSVTLEAKGGNGVSVGAGGGGGGVVDIKRCPAGWSSVLNTYANGGTPNGAGTAGGNGLVNISDDAAICSIN